MKVKVTASATFVISVTSVYYTVYYIGHEAMPRNLYLKIMQGSATRALKSNTNPLESYDKQREEGDAWCRGRLHRVSAQFFAWQG